MMTFRNHPVLFAYALALAGWALLALAAQP
jgi:hypothetical protein